MKRFLLAAIVLGAAIISPAWGQDAKNPRVVMETSAGKIVIELYADKAPATVKNFLQYAEEKHYDGTIFHRVIADFMIQGGGFEPGMKEKKTREPVKNEAGNGVKNERGTLAMARTKDPDSATSQFFINTVDNPRLDRAKARDKFGYCVFGKVVEGLDVVDQIRRAETGILDFANVPVKDVLINSVRILKK